MKIELDPPKCVSGATEMVTMHIFSFIYVQFMQFPVLDFAVYIHF